VAARGRRVSANGSVVPGPPARHLTGGNRFDDIRLDIAASISDQEAWLAGTPKVPVPAGTAPGNWSRLFAHRLLRRTSLWDAAVGGGLLRSWFEDFKGYWHGCLGGRPITLWDFRPLLFHYRCRFQRLAEPTWSSPAEHVGNWQRPEGLFATLQAVSRGAVDPVRSWALPRLLRPGVRALEYGCGVAPMYRTWRQFFAHIPTRWVLADIPGFPFHYARHVYGADAGAEFVCITPDRFADPLQGLEGQFDLIVLLEVFEHLDEPRRLAGYLLDRLAPGGLLHFDYIESGATGLDTHAGLEQRGETLRYLQSRLDVLEGDTAPTGEIRGAVVGRKKP
jgi:2-polyprenyl-3-methyl-5-hydroxy-6-metoxy-1,4-benzoquinol methylase